MLSGASFTCERVLTLSFFWKSFRYFCYVGQRAKRVRKTREIAHCFQKNKQPATKCKHKWVKRTVKILRIAEIIYGLIHLHKLNFSHFVVIGWNLSIVNFSQIIYFPRCCGCCCWLAMFFRSFILIKLSTHKLCMDDEACGLWYTFSCFFCRRTQWGRLFIYQLQPAYSRSHLAAWFWFFENTVRCFFGSLKALLKVVFRLWLKIQYTNLKNIIL